MSKFNLDCKVAATNAMQAARTELRLFCHIMGIADNIYNHFIGDDPYGVVDFQDGLYDFSMTDIHVVVSDYEHWLELYGSNEALARAVRQWYYWSLDWHEKHRPIEWHDPSKVMPPEDKERFKGHKRYISVPVLGRYKDGDQYVMCYQIWRGKSGWVLDCGLVDHLIEPDAWSFLPNDDGTYCPNLRSWLAGCPVPGLREATERYKAEQAKSLEECRKRTKEAQEAFDKCIAETKGE